MTIAWTDRLITKENKKGDIVVVSVVANVMTILANDERVKNLLAYDAFGECVITTRPPPWSEDDAPADVIAGDWTDADDVRLAAWFVRNYGISLGTQAIREAVRVAAERLVVHPVREWLRSLKWDGNARVDTLFSHYFGAVDDEYTRFVSSSFLLGAVARIEQPGAKVDTMPIGEGPQGGGKSSGLRALAGDQWFAEISLNVETKDGEQDLHRKWIIEFAELGGLSRAETSKVKAFISKQVARYRPSFGHRAGDFPRQCVFVGSVNEASYLKDPTGARRFLPFRCGKVDVAGLQRDRSQLLAEAHTRYQRGERWYTTDTELSRLCANEQELRFEIDPWEPIIQAWINHPGETKRRTDGVTTGDVLTGALRVELAKWNRGDEMRVANVLSRLQWEAPKNTVNRNGARVRPYRPKVVQVVSKVVQSNGSEKTHTPTTPTQPTQPKDVFVIDREYREDREHATSKTSISDVLVVQGDQKPAAIRGLS